MHSYTFASPARANLRAAAPTAAIFAALTVVAHIVTILWSQHLGYGYFRDEFYYLACGRHLAWGFVDHGPIVAIQARLAQAIFGSSILGIRMFSVLAAACAVAVSGLLAAALGAGRAAQILTMCVLLLAPIYFGAADYLSMNSAEPLFWTTCILALVLLLRGLSPRACWIAFGVSAGIGLLNKPSMTFFLLALGAGLLLTPQRRILFTRYAAPGIAILFLIAVPNVIWQIANHWPTLEFLRNGTLEHKNTILGPGGFLLAQLAQMNPVTFFLWFPGLISLLRGRSMPGTRFLGFAAVLFFAGMFLLHAKDYYLAPIYPILFAAGAIAWQNTFARHARFALPAYAAVVVLTGLMILPMASPVLAPDSWVRYTTRLHLVPGHTENAATSELPQFFADRFGWTDYTTLVLNAYHSLSPADRQHVCIYADNYGEAGALDFLGRRADPQLPPVLSGHNSYWTWGTHGCDGSVLIAITGDTPEQVGESFHSVTIAGRMSNPLAMPYEHKNVYILRDRVATRPFSWQKYRFYI